METFTVDKLKSSRIF